MFKAIGGLGNISSMLNNVQHIGPTMQRVADQMRQQQVTASAGDGAVEVTLNGIGQMLEIRIAETARQHTQLSIWILEASNLAGAEAKRQYADAISQAADQLNLKLPGLDAILDSLTGGA